MANKQQRTSSSLVEQAKKLFAAEGGPPQFVKLDGPTRKAIHQKMAAAPIDIKGRRKAAHFSQ
jgi:hypothetical protein